MSNLRRKALEHNGEGINPKLLNPNKTISRKAASRASSAASSRAGSRTTSRATSRQVSEDEWETDDAATVVRWGQDSLQDEMLESSGDPSGKQALKDIMDEVLDRKRSSVEGREWTYSNYIRYLLANYSREDIYDRAAELVDAFLRSIKGGRSEKEAILATRAICLTIVTNPTDYLVDKCFGTLMGIITDHESTSVKALAICTLSIARYYVGNETEIRTLMSHNLDIICSDGQLVGAGDSAEVVTAALEGWGLLCTVYNGDIKEVNDESMDAFIDQLDSTSVEVQTAAGRNIALLYELSYTVANEDMDDREIEFFKSRGKMVEFDEQVLVQKYQPCGRENDLLNTLSGLTKGTKRHMNKKDRRTQHSAFQTILRGVEHPLRTEGSPRQKLVVRKDYHFGIDEWWKLVRVTGLKSILKGGWQTHLLHNESFLRKLGLEAQSTDMDYRSVRSKPRGKKQRWQSFMPEDEDTG
ncbi:interferon-related developmental regulator-domain-containing protein [Kalaharituber pfeilii]|nr:interferon-related developmental regulator-domain-containing protein [Kalaharituber pfeilii]